MKTKGKINAIRRRVGKALRYLAATVTTAIGFYVLFSLLFSTEEEKRLQQENDLYATYYQELREKERLVTDVVEGLEMRDDALYRRIGGDAGAPVEEIRQGPFVLNTRNRTLEKNGEKIKLTQVEYSIVKMFMQNPGKALSREEILAAVWGRDYDGELKIVDVNIRRLRIKIEDDTSNPVYLTTVWGYGYKWGV